MKLPLHLSNEQLIQLYIQQLTQDMIKPERAVARRAHDHLVIVNLGCGPDGEAIATAKGMATNAPKNSIIVSVDITEELTTHRLDYDGRQLVFLRMDGCQPEQFCRLAKIHSADYVFFRHPEFAPRSFIASLCMHIYTIPYLLREGGTCYRSTYTQDEAGLSSDISEFVGKITNRGVLSKKMSTKTTAQHPVTTEISFVNGDTPNGKKATFIKDSYLHMTSHQTYSDTDLQKLRMMAHKIKAEDLKLNAWHCQKQVYMLMFAGQSQTNYYDPSLREDLSQKTSSLQSLEDLPEASHFQFTLKHDGNYHVDAIAPITFTNRAKTGQVLRMFKGAYTAETPTSDKLLVLPSINHKKMAEQIKTAHEKQYARKNRY